MENKETLEDAAERLYSGVDRQIDRMLFIAGAKWQQERMYSEEDMRKCWDACKRFDRPISEGDAPNFNELIEQFKKK